IVLVDEQRSWPRWSCSQVYGLAAAARCRSSAGPAPFRLLFGHSPSSGSVRNSPPVVGESPVGLRHLVDIFLALGGGACVIRRVEQFVGQAVGHGALAALP